MELALTLLREVGGMAPCGAPRELLILSKPLEKLPVHWGQGEVKVFFLRAKPPWSTQPLLQMIS